MRIWIGAFCVAMLAAGPAMAQWQVRLSGTTAGVWVRNDDGTSLALNCEGDGEGRLRIDLTVIPTGDPPAEAGTARFEVGGVAVDMATERYGPEGQRLQILRLDEDYFAEDITALRTELKRGAVLTLPGQPGFEAVQFALQGSGAAIDRLEEACLTVWENAARLRGE